MTYRVKLFLLTLLPVVLIVIAIISVVNFQAARLEQQQVQATRDFILNSKKTELRNYLTMAEQAISPLYNSVLKDSKTAEREAAEILRKMAFTQDNYFFVYDGEGTNLVHPRLTYLIGKNWIGLKDKDGKEIIADLIKAAKNGGEYYSYVWQKPSTKEYVQKLALSTYFERWDWMLGTGIYLDDVDIQLNLLRSQFHARIDDTRWVILGLSLAGIVGTGAILLLFQLSEQRLADSRLKALNNRIVDVQEQERKRVAHDLHDGISQLLVSSRYGLEAAISASGTDAQNKASLENAMSSLDNALAEVRRISLALRPVALDDIGLAAAIKSLGKEFERDTGIKVEAEVEPVRDLLKDEAKTALYRVVQEALTNVSKHANAENVRIELRRQRSVVRLKIEDNGNFGQLSSSHLQRTKGLGIRNMRERIISLDGQIQFSKSNKGGLLIKASLPINSAS